MKMDFLSLAKKRYACRKYTAAKVEPEKLAYVLEAARVAPTGANRQPQRLIVVQSAEGLERLTRCTRDFGAPCAVIVCADTDEVWQRKYDGKKIADIDASIVTDHMMLAAASQGLDTLWICMFKPEAVREEFSLPDHGKKIADIDASIVTDHMMLAAASQGLDTLWICMFKPEAVREEFSLPDHLTPVNILLLGYGDGEAASPDRHAETRKPLEATVRYE